VLQRLIDGLRTGFDAWIAGPRRSIGGVSTWYERRHESHERSAGVLGIMTSKVENFSIYEKNANGIKTTPDSSSTCAMQCFHITPDYFSSKTSVSFALALQN